MSAPPVRISIPFLEHRPIIHERPVPVTGTGFVERPFNEHDNLVVTDNAPAVKEKMDDGDDIHIVDVRTVEDFGGKLGHITEAINIPLEEMTERLSELDDNLEKMIALVCTTDRRSAKAATILSSHGFADVHVVKGGMTDWNAQAYPIET